MSPEITRDEWLAALAAVQAERAADDPGQSAEELSVLWGISVKRTHRALREINRRGRLVMGHRRGMRLDGQPYRQPCYRLLP